MAKSHWTHDDIADQSGRVAIVTGANSGIGYETARWLAIKGAHVVLACRNMDKANDAVQRISGEELAGEVEVLQLDLSDLESVRSFAKAFTDKHDQLDMLVANAGVMMPPQRRETKDGFELQLGTNHLGHFALIGLLLEPVLSTDDSRVVVVSSTAATFGTIDFDDLQWETRRFRRWASYGQSKLANLLFVLELQRKLDEAGKATLAAASHPGWTRTNLQKDTALFRFFNPMFSMRPPQGALPSLYAATAADVTGGDYFGPHGMGQMRGYPVKVRAKKAAYDSGVAARLWNVSEELTGVSYDVLEQS